LKKIKHLKKFLFSIGLALIVLTNLQGQQSSKINIEHSDFGNKDEDKIADAVLLQGNVRVNHEGVVLTCNKAYWFQKENYIKAFGDVQMVQGDTLFLNSKYAEYSGEVKKAYATGNVIMRSPESTLVTDTINFDRNTQEAFYNSLGIITNKENILRSKAGRYYANEKKFKFLTAVTITNPKYVIKSNHLDYYTNSGHSYLFGPSTITSKENFIYTEKGFYDTKKNFAYFKRKSYIKYKDRRIEGDSLYYDRNREYASATNNVKITDTINKGIVKGHYAEIFRNLKTEKDSMIITKRAVAITLVEKDSMYVHGKKMIITGKSGERIVRAFNNVRFYKIDMSGKCDSIHSNQKTGLTKMIKNPILWNYENQMTGDVMHLIGNNKTEKLDSLKVLNNSFIISEDTLSKRYNQVKGQNLYGKFIENKLREVDVVKNTEVIYYMRNDNQELIGINKSVSSKINMLLDKNTIETITNFNQIEGDIYPETELPEDARTLRGFVWRGDERIKDKDDIFPPEENELDAAIKAATLKDKANDSKPLKPSAATLNYDKKNTKPKVKNNKANAKPMVK
jgi:lipopolysaccharide export system protein LptA